MKTKRFLFLLALGLSLAALSGCLTHSVEDRRGEIIEKGDPLQQEYPPYRVVVGYTPSWTGDVEMIDYDKLTHINYAFHVSDEEGNILPTWTGESMDGDHDLKLERLVRLAQKKKVKVSLAVGGANDKNFGIFAVHSDRRDHFYTEIERVVREYNLDGIDLDWEFPETPKQGAAFEALMLGVRRTLDNIRDGLLLTAAVGASSYGADYTSGKALEPCDWINIMSYDLTGPWPTSGIGSTAPMSFVTSAIDLWKKKGISTARMAIGIPFYGMRFSMKNRMRVDTRSVPFNVLSEIFELDRTTVNDTNIVIDTISGDTTTQLFFWDSPQFVAEKTVYALSQKTRGMMIWEVSQDVIVDSLSLLNAIWQEMQDVALEIEKLQ